jgi:uncharacterized RDD family membrane protein YckC
MSASTAAVAAPGVYAKAPTQVLGRRTVAIIIDALLLTAVIGGLFFALATKNGSSYSVSGGKGVLFFAVAILLPLLYHSILEGSGGATIGKAITGIRVRNKNGGRASFGRALVRNILRIIDGLFYYLVGWIIAMASGPRRTRLGDMVGGTVVVRSKYA